MAEDEILIESQYDLARHVLVPCLILPAGLVARKPFNPELSLRITEGISDKQLIEILNYVRQFENLDFGVYAFFSADIGPPVFSQGKLRFGDEKFQRLFSARKYKANFLENGKAVVLYSHGLYDVYIRFQRAENDDSRDFRGCEPSLRNIRVEEPTHTHIRTI
jgi:hypothetical protein